MSLVLVTYKHSNFLFFCFWQAIHYLFVVTLDFLVKVCAGLSIVSNFLLNSSKHYILGC